MLTRQDVCSLCAFRIRYGAQLYIPRNRPVPQSRYYHVAKAARAAVAPKEEDEDDSGYLELPSEPIFKPPPARQPAREPAKPPPAPNFDEYEPDWPCQCGHMNFAKRSRCWRCKESRPPVAGLQYPNERNSRAPVAGLQYPNEKSLRPSDAGSQNPKERSFRVVSAGESRTASTLPVERLAGFRRFSPKERSTTSVSPDQPLPSPQKSNRLSMFGREKGDRSTAPAGSSDSRGFGAFLDSLSKKEPSSERSKNARGPSTGREGGWGKSSTGFPQKSSQYNLGVEYPRSGVSQPVWGNRSSAIGDKANRLTATDDVTTFTPLRKVKVKGDMEYNRRWDTTTDEGTTASEDFANPLISKDQPTIMPPAESSFENYEDERRKKRNNLNHERSQRYLIDDADTNDQQNANNRGKSTKIQRRSEREIDEERLLLEDEFEERRKKKSKKQKAPVAQSRPALQLPDFISVEQLSRVLKVRVDQFLRKLEEEGFEGARYDHILDAESSAMIADIYGFEVTFGGRQTLDDLVPQPEAKDKSLLPSRPPVVTIMGHVDHGKTTILDWLRKSSVVASEHGGITQHIGAFSVTMPGSERQITFLDTPGHAAFLDMRRRGAVVTDIVVLVVAADDSVKPQTIEAIKHALDAKVHIIVAINKVDKEDANVTRVKQDLAANGIVVEDYGGEYQAIELSGKTGKGMEELEEAILTLADVSDFRAEVDGQAEGWILESKVTPAGRVATILVRRGTLRGGDFIVAGTTWARVKTLRNDAGVLVDEALPGTPVQVDGWRGEDPTAGLEVLQAQNEEHAKDVVEIRLERLESQRLAGDLAAMNSTRTEEAEARAKVLAWEAEQTWAKKKRKPADNEGWIEGAASKGAKLVHFVIKADVAGSVEALVAAVSAVGNNEIRANVIHSGTGVLSESDIRHLAATGETAYAISFNQPVDGSISQLARAAGLEVLDHNIIYKVTDDVREKLSAELPPQIVQRVVGEAEIGKVFEITTKQGKVKIAGCKINNGSISRSHQVRVLRNGETIFTGKLDSLKNVKKDVSEMRKGTECGMGFNGWEDFEEGDQVQTFEEEKTARKLY